MPKKMSEFTEAVLSISAEVAQAKERASEADPVPLMMERMTRSQGRKEYQGMTEFQRQMFLDTNGQEKLLAMARGGSEFNA